MGLEQGRESSDPRYSRRAFLMLTGLFGDAGMARIFSKEATVQGWLDAERALARAQAGAGILTHEESVAIEGAAVLDNIDLDRLWEEAREVGYPILPLVRMIARMLPDGPNGRVHYGATTQDIMDTGLALQLSKAIDHLDDLVFRFGEALAVLTEGHRRTVLAARTHAQQAVPTTFGNKLAVYLSELTRHRYRLAETRNRACVVSLYGAGGTSAALGQGVREIRRAMAGELDLGYRDVAWHVSRDAVAEFGQLCASTSGTCARFAREVIDLSRTEIGEVSERQSDQKGASSTMPQKANPIGSESVVGMAGVASALSSALYRAMEAGHERAAGEWQIEWEVVPELASLAAGCLSMASEISEGLQVFPDAMRRNMDAEGGCSWRKLT